MMLARLALRNVRRNARRSALSAVAVVAGVAALVFGRGLIAGVTENLVRSQIDTVSGHVLIQPADERRELPTHPIEALFQVDAKLQAALDAVSSAWTPRLLFSPTLVVGADTMRVRGIGVDAVRDEQVLPRDTWRVLGALPVRAEEGLLVGAGIARLFELDPGDTVVLQTRTPQGAINALRLPVAGVLSAGNPWIDTFGVLMPLPLAQDLLLSPGAASHVAIRLADRDLDRSDAAVDALRPHLPTGTSVATWRVLVDDMLALQRVRERALNLLVFALLGISATGIANTVLMAAYERVREIGTLRAMGMTDRAVMALFLAEGAILGVFGATVGCLLGGAAVGWLSRHGIDLTETASVAAGGQIPVSTMITTAFDPPWIVASWVFGVLVATLASVFPARVAVAMAPAEAVRR